MEDKLDLMLRNPKMRFRKLSTLAQCCGDTSEGHADTKAALLKIGARHNLRSADTWTKDEYWVKDGEDWKLKDGIEPGTI